MATKADSHNTKSPSRRAVLSGAVTGLASLALPAVAMSATVANDAELLALVEKFLAAEQQHIRLGVKACAIEEECHKKAPRPDVLRVRPEDAELGLPEPFMAATTGKLPEFYERCDVDRLASAQWNLVEKTDLPAGAKAIANPTDPIHRHLEPGSFVLAYTKYTPEGPARARADEIVDALDEQYAAIRRVIRRSGLRAAERKRDRACDRACRIADQIAEMPAYTLAGLMAKARCITLLYKDAEIVIDGSATGSDLALSIAADLVEMGKATA